MDHHQGFVLLLSQEPLSAFCPARSIFCNMAPVLTYILVKVIPPTSFWMTPMPLVVSWTSLFYMFVQPLSSSHETCPAHWCLLAKIWWITSVMPVFKQTKLALFLLCSVSPIIIHFILHCVVTIFCSCVSLRDHA